MDSEIQTIAEEQGAILLEDINKKFHEEIEEFSNSFQVHIERIKVLINNLIYSIQAYQNQIKIVKGEDCKTQQKKLDNQKNLIYKNFFELQNLINMLLNQKIVMTYVHTDSNGQKEIRIFDNNIEQIESVIVNNHGKSYAALQYQFNEHFQQLKNSLPDEENIGLQNTAAEVEARYLKHKKDIIWKFGEEIYGYHLTNRGPINEAFVDFYLQEVKLTSDLMNNIHIFMTSENPQGVIRADNANGFLIGDISFGGLQLAVKGQYGGPQQFTQIINELKKIQAEGFSQASFRNFIHRFKEAEREKASKLVRPMLEKRIKNLVQYHGNKLFESYLKL